MKHASPQTLQHPSNPLDQIRQRQGLKEKMRRPVAVFLASAVAWLSAQPGSAAEPALNSDLHLSADLQTLFREEMRELLTATQSVAAALPVANWTGIGTMSATMRHGYLLEKALTRAQEEELSHLPDEFKALDEAFHGRAERLEHAAVAHDAEAVAFQFSRLLESCATCHAKFAKTRFPGFGTPHHADGVAAPRQPAGP